MLLADSGAAAYWWVPVATAALGFITVILERTRRSVQKDRQQAEGARERAEVAHRDTQDEGRAFVGVIVDLQRRIDLCTAEASAARDDAREAVAAEKECKAEMQRLRGVVEGVLSDRRRDA